MTSALPRLPESAIELERHLRRRHHAVDALLVIDGEERWGHPGPERAAVLQADAAALVALVSQSEAELGRAVPVLRAADPVAFEAWVAAQEALLDDYLAELDRAPDPDRVRTERFVAETEREGWSKVRAGALAFVDQSGFFVKRSPALYAALFGMDP